MSSKSEIATKKFLDGYNCGQAVLEAFRDEVGLDKDFAPKIAAGLGAGNGPKEEICGALTAGVLILSLRHGRGRALDRSATEKVRLKTKDLMVRFTAKHGSCLCHQLLQGYDLATEEGRQRVKADDILRKVCLPCVLTAVEILEDIK